MAKLIDTMIQEAAALQSLIQKYQTEFSERGFGPERVAAFTSALDDLFEKDGAQRTAHSVMLQRTQEQNDALERCYTVITKLQNAAKAAFGHDKAKLAEFRVGQGRPTSVKQMLAVMDYFIGVAQKFEAELLANGMSQDDVKRIGTLSSEVLAAETVQENARKLRVGATEVRDAAADHLREEIFRVRRFALARFADDPVKLLEFTAIATHKSDTQPEDPAPPAPAKTLVGADANKP